MSTELIPTDKKQALAALETVAQEYGLMATKGHSEMERTYILAEGMAKMKAMLTPEIMKPIMALQGSSLGFRTDKDSAGGYPLDVVREVAAEAFLRGFRGVGNEFNIIANRFYAAKDGCRRQVLEYPGLSEFEYEMSFPRDEGGKAYVEFVARWKLDGRPDELVRAGKTALSIRRNTGMIDDAVLGKAERKMFAAILSRLNNFIMPEGEVDAEPVAQAPSKVKRSSLNDFAPPAPPAPTWNPDDQAQLVGEWCELIAEANDVKRLTEVQREAAKSASLSPDSLAAINKAANARRAVLPESRF